MQFWYVQVLTRGFYKFFLSFLEDLPQFDALAVAGQHFHVLALITQPVDAGDFLLHIHAPQRVELFRVRLELSEVLVLWLLFFIVLERLEDDYPASLVAQTQELAAGVELYYGDYILLHYFLVGSLVAEYLSEFVVARLAH